MALQAVIHLQIKMHEVQEEYLVHPVYLCLTTQEVLRVTPEMIMEEEITQMSQGMTRLFIRMMQIDPLESQMVIRIQMVLMIGLHGCISP